MHDLPNPSADLDEPFELVSPEARADFIVVCDHASNALPPEYGTLGLDPAESRFSRLVIDPNRGEDDPTIVMKLSDGAIVPGNRDVDACKDKGEFARRIALFHAPYHAAIERLIARARALDIVPVIVSVHSFTPRWRSFVRPWETGLLWDKDDRMIVPLLTALRAQGFTVGDNEPYTGKLRNDCMYAHATVHGLPHVLIEIRQDLIESEEGQAEWATRYAKHLLDAASAPGLRKIRFFGSHTDPSLPISE